MIRINLLGDDTALDYSNRYLLAGIIIFLTLFSLFAVRTYSSVKSEIRELTIKSNNLTQELTSLQEKTKIVKDLESKQKAFESKLTSLARLRRNKIGPVRLLDDLNKALPERVWIRELSESRSSMKLLGRALDNQDIALFIKQLQSSDYVRGVDLVESRQVYYSKKSGQVTATPDVSLRGGAGSEGRVTKSSGFSVRGEDTATRSRLIQENNIKIKEFTLQVSVNYSGKLLQNKVKSVAEEKVSESQFKELDI